jgi:peptidoglycan/LPS O-acetylase OafA/YrhL
VLIGAAFASLLVVLAPYDPVLCQVRVFTPLRWIGDRCYSLYLVHWPIVRLLVSPTAHWSVWALYLILVPLGVTLSVLAAIPFHRYIERPCLPRIRHVQDTASTCRVHGIPFIL